MVLVLKEPKESKTKNIPCSRLGQILFTVLNDSGVNLINTNSLPQVIEQLTSITKSFQDKEKLIAKDIALAKCYRYLLSEPNLIKTKGFLQKAK